AQRVDLVAAFYAGADDESIAESLDTSPETVERTRLALHLVRERETDGPIELSALRERLPDTDVPTHAAAPAPRPETGQGDRRGPPHQPRNRRALPPCRRDAGRPPRRRRSLPRSLRRNLSRHRPRQPHRRRHPRRARRGDRRDGERAFAIVPFYFVGFALRA